ncbi:hypothetical protein OAH77_06315 [Flavobacteriaceae bacterium]|nr:hypothetical protein [Flavobacteriaceae bacterium]
MSILNFTRKVFLDRQELTRFQEFLQEDVVARAIIGNTTNFGIIQTEFINEDQNFRVSVGSNSGTIQIVNPVSQAIDADRNLIRFLSEDNISVPNDGNYYWVRISFLIRRHELGTVNIDASGNITGNGTTFTQVVRGRATNVPTIIRFTDQEGNDAVNNRTYEVEAVLDDFNIRLTANQPYTPETNLNYIVVGTSPIGQNVSDEQRVGLYNYDSCNLEFIPETVTNTQPTLTNAQQGRFFFIARVRNQNNIVTVEDTRDPSTDYWQFNISGLSGTLAINRNLGDLTDRNTARTNIAAISTTDVDEEIRIQADRFDDNFANYFRRENNLSEINTDALREEARNNLGILPISEINTQVDAAIDDAINENVIIESGSFNLPEQDRAGRYSVTVNFNPTLSTANYHVLGSIRFIDPGSADFESFSQYYFVISTSTSSMEIGFINRSVYPADELIFDYALLTTSI